MRTFKSGAMRDGDEGKIDPEAALSPLVLEAYCSYMSRHRLQSDGKLRENDDWQKGIPLPSYMKSLLRHVLEAWRAYRSNQPMNDALFAIMFNTMGMLHEKLKTRYGVPYVNENGDNCTMVNAAAMFPIGTKTQPWLESQQEWLEFHRNMTASSLPNEASYHDLVLQGLEDQAGPQSSQDSS